LPVLTLLPSILIPRRKISLILRLFSSTNTTQPPQDTLFGKNSSGNTGDGVVGQRDLVNNTNG